MQTKGVGHTPIPRIIFGLRLPLMKRLASSILLLLMILSLRSRSSAEDADRCGHSTVEEAWGPRVAAEARSFLLKLQRIIKMNDKKQFSSLVHYPIRVLDRDRVIEIFSPTELIDKYSTVLTPDVEHAILAQSASCLFGNGQGMMVGRGQLWFQKESSGEMKIITINPSAPPVGEK